MGVSHQAFKGDGATERIVLGRGVRSIGARAFADTAALKQVVIPNMTVTIDESAFENVFPTIVCPEGGAAAVFAAGNGLAWVCAPDSDA